MIVPQPSGRLRDGAASLVHAGATVSASLLGMVASLRRAPALHPVGSVHRARTTIERGDHVLARLSGEADALVRTSRGAGLPPGLPDILGLAVRTEGESGLDLLLASSGRGRLTRHLLRPGREARCVHYSSLAPFVDDGGRRFVIGASFTPDGDGRRLTLEVASPGGRWEPVGELTLLDRLEEGDRGRLAFDPWRTPAWMRPAGALNRLRRPAYRASQAARPGPPDIPLSGRGRPVV